MHMEHTIANHHITVSAVELGAELQQITGADGTEFLWQGDPAYWRRRAPNLFPYIARLTNREYTFRGKRYSLPIHGFAPASQFKLTYKDDAKMIFSLASSRETFEKYPFEFMFEVIYEIHENILNVTYRIENKGAEVMYFGIGAHPGFHVPLETSEKFEDYYLDFGETCNPIRIGFSEDCYLNGDDKPYSLEENQKLVLSHMLFDYDAIVLKEMPKTVTLKSKLGKHSISVHYPDMKYLGLWHMPKTTAPYICIEPWSSLPSRKGIIEDLEQQDSLLTLSPGKIYRNSISFTFV